ncbi:MAG TPA: tetratricopeptide repeat protein [Vicinamibacteria bacterium]|nr:tetratricopeptide repeat protein [Vicinamibacteria bacterium]
MARYTFGAIVLSSIGVVSCATKRIYTVKEVPAWDVVENTTLGTDGAISGRDATRLDAAWRAVREGRLEVAAESLQPLERRYGENPAVDTALGYIELRSGENARAEEYFQTALGADPRFGPARAGHFLVALTIGEDESAYERLTQLEQTQPQNELVERYKTTLQVKVAESRLRRARELVSSSRLTEAADAYSRVLEVAPEAGAVYLETAEAELAGGLFERAVIHARQATELEPDNADAFRVLAESSYASDDLQNALEAYRSAVSLRPSDRDLVSRYDEVRSEFEERNLPPEYFRIGDATRVTREQLAALVYLELRDAFDGVDLGGNVIAMDISDSWAAEFIRRVVAAGVLEVFPNHTFQPKAFVNRVDLAETLKRALEILAPDTYRVMEQSSRLSIEFPDLTRENVAHDAAALSVSIGLIRPGFGGAFEPQRFVSGEDAAAAVRALSAHVAP